MHVRDEHVRGCETKSRLKRRFKADGAQSKSTAMDCDPPVGYHVTVQSVDEVVDG